MSDGDLFKTGRICDYCGGNQDAKDVNSLKILHSDCVMECRIRNTLKRRKCNVREDIVKVVSIGVRAKESDIGLLLRRKFSAAH
jgi:hypothetical protein